MQSGGVRLAFFRSSLEQTCDMAHEVLFARRHVPDWERLPPHADLQALMRSLPVPAILGDGVFFQSTACDAWTGFAMRPDDDTHALVRAMCERHPRVEALITSDDADDAIALVREFELIRKGRSVRHVRVERDSDGYRFVSKGVPLTEEDAFTYSRRHIPERLCSTGLRRVLIRMGVDLDAVVGQPVACARLLRQGDAPIPNDGRE